MSVTWELLDDDGRVWGAVIGGDLVRLELSGISTPIGAAGALALEAVFDAVHELQRNLSGHRVKQISIGAAGFGFDQLGSARDIPVVIEPGAARA